MKYQKKPVVVDAWQIEMNMFLPEGAISLVDFYHDYVTCITPEGKMRGKYGDFLIRGVAGEYYICDKDIFKQTYEELE